MLKNGMLIVVVSCILCVLLIWSKLAHASDAHHNNKTKVVDAKKGTDIEVRAVADTEAVTPGKAFRLGAQFQLQDPWHVYWKYPGKMGLPTRISFEVPDGTVVGDLEWPKPITFVQPGGYQGFGYEKEVFLGSAIQLPNDYDKDEVSININTRWLGCSPTRCVPGKKQLSITLPVIR